MFRTTTKQLRPLLLLPVLAMAVEARAQRTVSGRISDAQGNPLAGASVQVKGTTVGTTTDASGNYSISVPAGANTLVISNIGFADQEIAITGTTADVRLSASTSTLNDVVVVGYGTQRKRDLAGSVVSVTSKDFQRGNITSPEQLVAGKVAGLTITTSGGAPGAGSAIRIRGGASLNASNDPLIIVDGVVLESGGGGVAGSANALNLINPNDIESFNVLKDASATAIYGSRASNGVIIITTKKGRSGKPVFGVNLTLSAQSLPKQVDVFSADEFRSVVRSRGTASQIALLGTANTNWQDEIYKTALAQDLNVSVAGALNRIPYRVSAGFLNQDGILKTGNFRRGSLGINLSPTVWNNHLRIDVNLKGALTTNRFADEGAIGNALSFDPTQPVFSGKSRFGGYTEVLDNNGRPNNLSYRNPLALLEQRQNNSDVARSIGNVQFDYKVHGVDGLRANLNLGYDVSRGKGDNIFPDSLAVNYNQGGQRSQYEQRKQNLLMEAYLAYDKTFGQLRLEAVGGHSYQDFKSTNDNFATLRFNGKDTVPGTKPVFPNDVQQNTLLSFFGRTNLTIANKYILQGSLRYDGSSRFSKDNRWGLFPAVAAAWRIKEESFLKNVRSVNDLKLRASYGVTGQQDGIANYSYLANYAQSGNGAQYQFGNQFFYMFRPAAYDANLKWETTETYNLGVDMAFADNRIVVALDGFYKKTRDLLAVVNIPAGSNFSNQLLTNVGTIENRGVEAVVTVVPVRTKNVEWSVSVNASANRPEITRLTLNNDPNFKGTLVGGIAGATGQTIQIQSVGNVPNSFYVLQQVYDKAGKPIENLFEDRNRDGVINGDDRYIYQSPNATVNYGFNSSITWKRFSASTVLRASTGNYLYNNLSSNSGTYRNIINPAGYLSNGLRSVLNNNFVGNTDLLFQSDYFVENASFLRMDNLNLGYDLGRVIPNTGSLRVGATIQNVFVITKYSGVDPEVFGGIDNTIYPRPRIFSVSANLSF